MTGVQTCALPISWNNFLGIITEETEDAKKWCEALKIDFGKSDSYKVIYLPLLDFGNPPFPSTIKELYGRLDKCDKSALKKFEIFSKEENSRHFVVLAPKSTSGRVLGLLSTPNLSSMKIPGFRVGKVPFNLLINRFENEKVLKFVIERVDKKRLFYRGGDGLNMTENVTLAVVGCGSIGGSLSTSLIKAGASCMDLIDPDILSIENIARHYCGMSDIGFNKADILSRRLKEKFPHVMSTSFPEDILHLLLNEKDFLNRYSLSVISIGNQTIERRLNSLLLNKSITSPMLFVWVEPMLVAGHALFINPNSQGCFECILDDNLNIKYKVIKNSTSFTQREAGCRTSFVPFGALEIDLFTNKVTRFMMAILNGNIVDSTLFTWIGDIENFRKEGHDITAMWESATTYSEHKIKLPDEKCSFCQK